MRRELPAPGRERHARFPRRCRLLPADRQAAPLRGDAGIPTAQRIELSGEGPVFPPYRKELECPNVVLASGKLSQVQPAGWARGCASVSNSQDGPKDR